MKPAIERLRERLQGRLDMNVKTSVIHPVEDVRRDAAIRVMTYQLVLSEIDTILKDGP